MNPFALAGSVLYYAWPGHWSEMARALRDPETGKLAFAAWNLSTLATYATVIPLSMAYPPWAREGAAALGQLVGEVANMAPIILAEARTIVVETFFSSLG
jgi:hypothetical protein